MQNHGPDTMQELIVGRFYWVNIISSVDQTGLFSDAWQPARYTGRSGDSVGETWDFIGLRSEDGHHFVDVVEIGSEIERCSLEADAVYRCRLIQIVDRMNDLDRYAVTTSIGKALDVIGSHHGMPRKGA